MNNKDFAIITGKTAIKIIFLVFVLLFITHVASATTNEDISAEVGANYIQWSLNDNFSYVNDTFYIDGTLQNNTPFNIYLIRDLNPNEKHRFTALQVVNNTTYTYYNDATTTARMIPYIDNYFLIFVVIIILIIAALLVPLLALIACFLACYNLPLVIASTSNSQFLVLNAFLIPFTLLVFVFSMRLKT